MKLFHGTNSDFNHFSLEYCGTNTQWDNCNRGIHLTNEIGMAQLFGANVIECTVNINKPLNLDGVFRSPDQAPDIVRIIFQDDIANPNEALRFLDNNISLGEFHDFKECFNSRETIEEFISLGYDHIIDRFAQDKIEYCVFNPSNISIVRKDIIDSKIAADILKVFPLNNFQIANARKAVASNDQRSIDFVIKQARKCIDSIPDKIDGYQLDDLSKLKILIGDSFKDGHLVYSVEKGHLYRTLGGMSMAISPVLTLSTEGVRKHSLTLNI